MLRVLALSCCFTLALLTDPPCVIDLQCAECQPDNMPLVTSRRAADGAVRAAPGDQLLLSCGAGRFLRYPLASELAVTCEGGRYRVPADGALRHLLDLGCQESVFEDVLHTVEHCSPPLQGRAYQVRESSRSVSHLATLCFDEDRALPTFAHACNAASNVLRMPPHAEQRSPLTLLGNFNQMFDSSTRHAAERLYSDDERLNRRLREIMRHERFSFAAQELTAGELLSARYFDDQNVRAADFASNKVAVWRSVAAGNLHHLHADVAQLLRLARPHAALDVYAGTHGTLALRSSRGREELLLRAPRFPVPRYVWTVVHDRRRRRALALVVLNDPFVSVSEIRESVFCESACGRTAWLHELRRHRNYEGPVYGLTFCCSVHNFTDVVPEMPKGVLADVLPGIDGMLTELYS